MLHLDEGTIHAWLDGELAPEDADAAARHVAECDVCRTLVAEARGLMAGATRIVSALDAGPAGVAPRALRNPGSGRRPWYRFAMTPVRMSIAATIVVAVGLSLTVRRADNTGSPHAARAVDGPQPVVASPQPVVERQIDSVAAPSATRAAGASRAPVRAASPPASVKADLAASPTPVAPSSAPVRGLAAAEQKTALADKQTVVEPRAQIAAGAAPPVAASAARFDSVRAKDEVARVVADSTSRAQVDLERRRPVARSSVNQLSEVVATGARDAPAIGGATENCYRLEIDSTSWRGILPSAFALEQQPARFGGGVGGRGGASANAAGAPRTATQPASTVLTFAPMARQGNAVRALAANGRAEAVVIGDWIAISADSINVNFATPGSSRPVAMLIVRASPHAHLTAGDRTDSVRVTRIGCSR